MIRRTYSLQALWLCCLLACTLVAACGEAEKDAALTGDGDTGDGDTGDGDTGDGDTGDGDGPASSCEDLDCGDHGTCDDSGDGAVCECETGFTLEDETCVDVDECKKAETNSCDDNATCTNIEGDYSCACNDGLEGDGFACEETVACDPDTEDCGGPKCPAGQTGDAEAGLCWCDLSGYWAMRTDVTLTLPMQEVGGTVFIKETVSKATLWELHRYEYDGTVIKVKKKGCGSDSYPRVESPAYGESYSSGVPKAVFDKLALQAGADIPLARDNALPEKTFTTPMEAALVGIKLDDPLNDPWPASTADVPDSAWVDVDGDGVPGISLWAAEPNCPATDRPSAAETICFAPVELEQDTTAISRRTACVSLASRVVTHLDVNIDACSRMTGQVYNDKTEARVHSCIQVADSKWNTPQKCNAEAWADEDTNVPCSPDQVKFLDEQDQSQMSSATFELVKVAGLDGPDVDCAMVRAKLPAIERN